MDGGIELRHGTRESQHQRNRVLGDADRISSRRVHHQNAAIRGRVNVHVVHVNARASDHTKRRRFLEKFGRHLRRAANDESFGIREVRYKSGRRRSYDRPTCFTQNLDSPLADFVRDNNFHVLERKGRSRFCQIPPRTAACAILQFLNAIYLGGGRMALGEQIQTDIVKAMREKDVLRLSTLRMVKSALQLKEVEKMRPLEDAEILQMLQTLLKQRRESVEQFTKGGRTELADKETKEIAIIETYLPAGASDAEMVKAIDDAVAETGANSMKQMGAVVKAAKAKLEGKTVDGKILSDRVRERLSKLG